MSLLGWYKLIWIVIPSLKSLAILLTLKIPRGSIYSKEGSRVMIKSGPEYCGLHSSSWYRFILSTSKFFNARAEQLLVVLHYVKYPSRTKIRIWTGSSSTYHRFPRSTKISSIWDSVKKAELDLPYVRGPLKVHALELNADYCRSQELPYVHSSQCFLSVNG